jgi:hypothetical protein
MEPLVLAHLGHVLIDLPVFFGPVAVLGGWMLMTVRRDRRRGGGGRS